MSTFDRRSISRACVLVACACPSDSYCQITIAPRFGSKAAGLDVRHTSFPLDCLDFRTCEAVLDGDRDFGLFQVELGSISTSNSNVWRQTGKTLGYRWRYASGILVEFYADPRGDFVELEYRVENVTTETLNRVHLHTCVVTTEAPSFFAVECLLPKTSQSTDCQPAPHSELYCRLSLWSSGDRFTFDSLSLSPCEPHIALMRRGHRPIQWAWWKNASTTFDDPVIALKSTDGSATLALGFEDAIWASANTGDERSCFHLFPHFGMLLPGQDETVRGRLLLIEGSPDMARDRLLRPHRAIVDE